jgi:anti-sigma factor RsiW
MASTPIQASPYVASFADYLDRKVTMSVEFNPSTRSILGATVTRDPECRWTRLMWGHPQTGNDRFSSEIPEGTTNVNANQVRAWTGADTIDEFLLVQFTAVQ